MFVPPEGTYFGLIFVFLKSKPIIEVPLGMINPPLGPFVILYKSSYCFVAAFQA